MNNASFEGMQRVRYVHLGILLSKEVIQSTLGARKLVALAINQMSKAFKGLQELDLEIALLWAPKLEIAEDFSRWLVDEARLGPRGLKRFVLNVSVLEKVLHVDVYMG